MSVEPRPVRPEILIPNGPGSRCRPPDRGPPGRVLAAILANPRYTGRQVSTGFDLADPDRHHPRAQTGAAVEPARRLGHLQAFAVAAGQRGRPHRRPGHGRRAAQPGRRYAGTCWPGFWPASGAGAPGISLVQRQTRLQVPPRLHQRHPLATRTAREHLRARGSDRAAPGRDGHPARRPSQDPARAS